MSTIEFLLEEQKKIKKEKQDNPNYDFDKLHEYYIEATDLFSWKEKRRIEIIRDGEVQRLSDKRKNKFH